MISRVHFVYMPTKWEMMLQCNISLAEGIHRMIPESVFEKKNTLTQIIARPWVTRNMNLVWGQIWTHAKWHFWLVQNGISNKSSHQNARMSVILHI